MSRPVVRTEHAEQDLAEILDYLDDQSPSAADRIAEAVNNT